jgi:predicted glycoside hydrolase/deacetylase ChbG (UPF0249 family)
MLDSPRVTPQRQLIVNADDFGLSPLTNQGIIQCRQSGVLTSTSLMVRAPAAAEAAHYAATDPEMSLGLHMELGEWALDGDQWRQTKFVVALDDSNAVRAEIFRQLDAFRQLTGRDPTHLDSHQHVHESRQTGVQAIMRELANQMGIILRGDSQRVRFRGAFFGLDEHMQLRPEFISVPNLLRLLGELQPGMTELSCHPGLDQQLNSSYRDARLLEVRTLCDPQVRQAIERLEVQLCAFPRGGIDEGFFG